MMLREQAVFSVQDVQYALLETTGKLSVLPKPAEQPATKQDVKADVTPPSYIPTEVVSDGQLIYENLVELELTEDWLLKKLKSRMSNPLKMSILLKFKQMDRYISVLRIKQDDQALNSLYCLANQFSQYLMV